MSRCKSCNIELTNFEDSLKGSNTNELVQLCSSCLPLPEADDDFGYFGDSETLEINDNIHLSDT